VCRHLHLVIQHSLAVTVEAEPYYEASHAFFLGVIV
jgi:hypothetical protein